MKKNNGFTLVEVLAVVVVISILSALAIPLVTQHMNNSRKKLFMEDALTVADAVRNDIIKGGITDNNSVGNCVGDFCYYNLTDINKLLEAKLDKSPFGNNYTTGEAGVCAVINKKTNEITMTMVDSDGNGFVDLVANTNDDSKSINNEKVNTTGDIKISDAKIALQNCTSSLKTVYRWDVRLVSVGDTLTEYETDPKELDRYSTGFYLKHTLDRGDVVIDSYVCYLLNNTEYCIQGGKTSYYNNNLSIINSSPGSVQCVSSSTEDCISQFAKFSVTASPYGYVRADGNGSCVIQGHGSSQCDLPGVE